MAAQADTIQLHHSASKSLTHCVIHTTRSPRLVKLLFVNNPSFSTTSKTCAVQLSKLVPNCRVTHIEPKPKKGHRMSMGVQFTVRSQQFGRWNHPLAKHLTPIEQHAVEVQHLLRKTFLAPPPPPPPAFMQSLLSACASIQWTDARRRPILMNWQGDPFLHRLFVLQLILVPHQHRNPPKTVLIVAPNEVMVNAWTLSVQNTATVFTAGAQDVQITITTPARLARTIRSGGSNDQHYDMSLVDVPTPSTWEAWSNPHHKAIWSVVHACASKLFLLHDPWLSTPAELPHVLRCMEEDVTTHRSDARIVWRGVVVRGTQWPHALLTTVFRDALFVWTPRTDWARGVQLGHIQQVTRQEVTVHLSVAQTWEYLLAGGASSTSPTLPINRNTSHNLPLPACASQKELSALCNATDRHARKNSKWSWLSAKLKDSRERRNMLPLVVFTETVDDTGCQLVARALSTSPKLKALRVRSSSSSRSAKDLASSIAAFNEGMVDVMVLSAQAVTREVIMTLARAVVFWEPCASAAEECRLLAACCPEPAAPLCVFTLVARLPKAQLKRCASTSMPQTDAWLRKKAATHWKDAQRQIQHAPPHWPRCMLWKALGGLTAQERRARRVQQQIVEWAPVVNYITSIGHTSTAPSHWKVAAHTSHRPVTRIGDFAPVRKRKAPVLSHHNSDAAAMKTLVTKLKRKTADTWRAWCPVGTTMAVWSRRVTPVVTQCVKHQKRHGWTLEQLVADASLMQQVATELGVATQSQDKVCENDDQNSFGSTTSGSTSSSDSSDSSSSLVESDDGVESDGDDDSLNSDRYRT